MHCPKCGEPYPGQRMVNVPNTAAAGPCVAWPVVDPTVAATPCTVRVYDATAAVTNWGPPAEFQATTGVK